MEENRAQNEKHDGRDSYIIVWSFVELSKCFCSINLNKFTLFVTGKLTFVLLSKMTNGL